MKNKEYGVELNVDISKYTKNLEKAKNLANKARKDIEQPLSEISWQGREPGQEKGLKKVKITGYEEYKDDGKNKMAADAKKAQQALQEYKDTIKGIYQERFKETQNTNVEDYTKQKENIQEAKKATEQLNIETEKVKSRATELREEYEKLLNTYNQLTALTSKKGALVSTEDLEAIEDIKDDMEDIMDELGEEEGTDFESVGIVEFDDNIKEAKDDAYGLSDAIQDMGDRISKSFNKGVMNIKRFSLSLLGIHSIWTALSRAARSYMALDSTLSTRMQANWIAVGAIFEPIIQKIVKGIQKIVAYINVFVKAFTGGKVDLLSRAMKAVEKSTNKTTKAIKGLNKELANLDEITNLNFDQTGGAGDEGDFGIGDALKEIQDIELDPKVVKFIDNLGKKLKEISDVVLPFFKDHLELVIGAVGLFLGLLAIDKIATFAQHISNLAGMFGNLGYQAQHAKSSTSSSLSAIGFAITLLITTTVGLISTIKRTNDAETENIEIMKSEEEQTKLLADAKDRLNNSILNYENAVDRQKTALSNLNQVQEETGMSGEEIYNQVRNGQVAYESLEGDVLRVYKAYREYAEAQDNVAETQKEINTTSSEVLKKEYDKKIAADKTGESYQQLKEEMIQANKEGKLSNEDLADSLSRMTEGMSADVTKTFTKDIPEDIKKGMNPGQYHTTLDKLSDVIIYKLTHLKNEIGRIFRYGLFGDSSGMLSQLGIHLGITLPGGLKLAKGNVAYGPTYAEFGEYAGARSNPEITAPQNMIRETLVEALQEANLNGNSRSGDTVLYVNGKELARATYNDYKEEGNRLGTSNVAIRRV